MSRCLVFTSLYELRSRLRIGHRILDRDYAMGPIRVLIWDPWPFGLTSHVDRSSYDTRYIIPGTERDHHQEEALDTSGPHSGSIHNGPFVRLERRGLSNYPQHGPRFLIELRYEIPQMELVII